MSLPPAKEPKNPRLTVTRIVIWIVVAAVGLYLLIAGIVGILAKG
ncbi:MAG TPA: hypothetical protein VGM70_00435 [Pseudolysinimonas sp.]|jgi:amino acid transporter